MLLQFGHCPSDRVFFSEKSSLSQSECQHKDLLSSWPQIRRIVGANHRGRGASDWCEIYSDANWRQNRCHQKIATTTANSNNIAPGRSLDSAECSLLRLRAICWIFFGLVSFALLHFEFATVVLLAPSTVRAILQLALVFKGFELDFLFCLSVNTQTEC